MTRSTNQPSPSARFKTILEETARLSHARVASEGLEPGQRVLSEWQVQRLTYTYADFEKQKRYKKAVDFFLTDIYGPVDFTQRDADIARIYPLMVKVLSGEAIESLAQGLEINALTMKLDAQLLNVMANELDLDLVSNPQALNFELYAQAYRLCDNFDERQRQIDAIFDIGKSLEVVTRKRLILTAVKVARQPAKLAGFGELQSFIERGLAAFRAMGDASVFLTTVHSRETKILEAIFANEEIPDGIVVRKQN